MNLNIHTETMKIVHNTKDPRPGASASHGGQGVFLIIPDPPWGSPFGGGANHRS